ncbi:MAG: FHA domain-containing protein, partial [Myxococcales bacterium]|nr:FHA domain-containing protein [Myxococcales bacterium]
MLRLVIEDDEGTTHVVPLIRDEITIGRQEGNTIRLTERNVSRRHARLVRTGDTDSPTVLVEDLDSFNGLKLNGDRVSSKCTMRPGDLIQIGDYSLALRVDQPSDKESRDTEISMGPPAGLDDVATQLHRVEDEVLPADEQGKLVVVSSNLAGTTYALDRREVIIGRTDENDVVVNHRSISRNHAKVIYRDGTFTIIDLASSNGVKVNGEDFGTASMVNGDIIELGHVKLRYVAPGDDYVFSLADIDDVQIDRGPGTGRLVLIGLLLVAVAGGAFMLVNRTVEPGSGAGATVDPPTPPKPTPPPAPPPVDPVDVDALMAEGQALLRDEKWAEATNVFDRVLQDQPEHAEAKRLKKQATRESEHKRRYDQLLQDTEDQQWHDAYFALVDFPDDSIYHPRLDTVRDKIQNGFADFEVTRARDLAKRGDLEGARKLQASLAEKPFAKAQADALAEELDEME